MGKDSFRLDAIDTIFGNPGYPIQPVEMSHENLPNAISTTENKVEHVELGKLWKEVFQYQVECYKFPDQKYIKDL